MPVPSSISDLSTTAGSNSPAGTDPIGTDADNYIRAHAAFIAALRDGSKNLEAGTATAPSLAFTGDSNTGIYSPAADQVAITAGGNKIATFAATWALSAATAGNTYMAFNTTTTNRGLIGVDGGAILSSGTGTNFGIRSEADLLLMAGASDAWRIDSTGRLKNVGNAQPSFHAELSANATSGSGALVFNTERHDQGSNYNNTTGVFTAPVNGVYMFTTSIFVTNNTGSAQSPYCYLNHSGTARGYSQQFVLAAQSAVLNVSTIIRMTASETMQVNQGWTPSASLYATGPSFSFFSGHLLG